MLHHVDSVLNDTMAKVMRDDPWIQLTSDNLVYIRACCRKAAMDAAAAAVADGEEPAAGGDDGTESGSTDIEETGSASAEQASTMQVESPPEAASLSSSASAEPCYVTPVKHAQQGTLFNYFAKK